MRLPRFKSIVLVGVSVFSVVSNAQVIDDADDAVTSPTAFFETVGISSFSGVANEPDFGLSGSVNSSILYSGASAQETARWEFTPSESGAYSIDINCPANSPLVTLNSAAVYTFSEVGGSTLATNLPINQNDCLGAYVSFDFGNEFNLEANTSYEIVLSNESSGTIAFTMADAVRFNLISDDINDNGVSDAWEEANFQITVDPDTGIDLTGNPDADNYSNLEEFEYDLDPNSTDADVNDADSDGLQDDWEVARYGFVAGRSVSRINPDDLYQTSTVLTNWNAQRVDPDRELSTVSELEAAWNAIPNQDSSVNEVSLIPNSYRFAAGETKKFKVKNNSASGVWANLNLPGFSELESIFTGFFNLAGLGDSKSCGDSAIAVDDYCEFDITAGSASTDNRAGSFVVKTNSNSTEPLTALENLSAALYNNEGLREQARRRLPPVLTSVAIKQGVVSSGSNLSEGETYDFELEVEGYGKGYQVVLALFDCSNKSDSCGLFYGSRDMISSVNMTSPSDGLFSYSSNQLKGATYKADGVTRNNDLSAVGSYTYIATISDVTIPFSLVGGAINEAQTVVVRFYYRNYFDAKAGQDGLSLIVAGDAGLPFYTGATADDAGRRLEITVVNKGD